GEVAILMDDRSRLDERGRKLQGHFAMAQKDIDRVVTSADKLTRRGAKIEALEFEAGGGDANPACDDVAAAKSVESRT
ncbi:DNA recombination protein RmuC, partial [Rhizobium ruizarguesonis]